MKVIWSREGLGFILVKTGWCAAFLLRSAIDGKPVIAWTPSSTLRTRVFRPFGGVR